MPKALMMDSPKEAVSFSDLLNPLATASWMLDMSTREKPRAPIMESERLARSTRANPILRSTVSPRVVVSDSSLPTALTNDS